jgi:WD40 repeat protein
VRVWPLGGQAPPPGRILSSVRGPWDLARSPDGRRLLVSTEGGARLLSVGDDSPITLADEDIDVPGGTWFTAFSRDGRLAAFLSADLEEATRKITIWDLASREQVVVLAKGGLRGDATPQFIGNEHLMSLDNSGLRRWNIDTGETDLLFEGTFQRFAVSEDRRRVLLLEAPTFKDAGRAIFVDLETGVATPLESHGNRVEAVALDIAGTFAVTGDRDGVVRVGPVTGEEPHVLFGHENSVDAVAIDPNGRWIASGGWDKTVRLWPMPDLSKPPLHTLPREELISKLKTLTNLRVVRDGESSTGWKLTHDPFPGWETVPTW